MMIIVIVTMMIWWWWWWWYGSDDDDQDDDGDNDLADLVDIVVDFMRMLNNQSILRYYIGNDV
jgi:hypothetical protein